MRNGILFLRNATWCIAVHKISNTVDLGPNCRSVLFLVENALSKKGLNTFETIQNLCHFGLILVNLVVLRCVNWLMCLMCFLEKKSIHLDPSGHLMCFLNTLLKTIFWRGIESF